MGKRTNHPNMTPCCCGRRTGWRELHKPNASPVGACSASRPRQPRGSWRRAHACSRPGFIISTNTDHPPRSQAGERHCDADGGREDLDLGLTAALEAPGRPAAHWRKASSARWLSHPARATPPISPQTDLYSLGCASISRQRNAAVPGGTKNRFAASGRMAWPRCRI